MIRARAGIIGIEGEGEKSWIYNPSNELCKQFKFSRKIIS
jgi:hypothetical protein